LFAAPYPAFSEHRFRNLKSDELLDLGKFARQRYLIDVLGQLREPQVIRFLAASLACGTDF